MLKFLRTAATLIVATATITIVASGPVDAAAVPPSGFDAPHGVTASFMIFDRATGAPTIQYGAHRQYRSASVVKLLIALDYLEAHGPDFQIPPEDLAVLQPMLRSSNDDAASILWVRGGFEAIIERMVPKIGLTDTAPPVKRGIWGYTAISAADVVKIYRYILDVADPTYRDFIMGNLRHATQCASDGFDQFFGIPRAVPRAWAVKQGWSGFGAQPASGEECVLGSQTRIKAGLSVTLPQTILASPAVQRALTLARAEEPDAATTETVATDLDLTRLAMHTTGTIGAHDQKIIAVLTLEPVGTSWRDSATRITALTRGLYLASLGV